MSMDGVFPQATGISRIRGILNLLKENRGSMEMSELAEESDEQIDDLLPLIEACRMLGFVKVDDSKLRLTAKGAKINISNFSKYIREGLLGVEPFKTASKLLDDKELETSELFPALKRKGIMLHGEDATNDIMLRKLFIRWGVRSKLMSYNAQTDTWSMQNK